MKKRRSEVESAAFVSWMSFLKMPEAVSFTIIVKMSMYERKSDYFFDILQILFTTSSVTYILSLATMNMYNTADAFQASGSSNFLKMWSLNEKFENIDAISRYIKLLIKKHAIYGTKIRNWKLQTLFNFQKVGSGRYLDWLCFPVLSVWLLRLPWCTQ